MKKDKDIKLYQEPTIKVVKFQVELGFEPSGMDTPTPGTDPEEEWVGRSVEGNTSRSVFDNTAASEQSFF